MQLERKNVRKSINKAWLKVKPNRSDIDSFKTNLIQLIDRINENESEEHHKKLISDFLESTYYSPNHYINTKGRNDQVIHNGKNAKSSVGVIIEAKKPNNTSEMLSKENINTKAFQELVLYYLRERITHKNLEVKHLIATNVYEWFVFDANVFEKLFAKNKSLVKQFNEFEAGRLSGTTTDFFYSQIAKPFIEGLTQPIEFSWFDLRAYEKPLRNENKKDDAKLIALFKLFSPEHLLKLPFANDSNSLDYKFYKELLHLIGLEETKEGSKKVIQRAKAGNRNSGSLLENTITQLDTMDKLSRLDKPSQFGASREERLFNVGLELCITWVNRILFLKLLEAQLVTYHGGDTSYAFLNLKRIKDYDELNTLFFMVLARKYEDRSEEISKAFANVPYLNSSLFEPTDLEQDMVVISNLRDNRTLPILSSTVLKNEAGKKRTGELNALEYLFAFLDAYDFSSEGAEDIQEDNKTLINASVLGLIFEKINGYKDGSFFTPGFITMYMCRETIRRAVVQKFNDAKGWKCETLDDLYEKIEDRDEANEIINSLKICDPAVGSGHFLVSALNEILAIKNDLNLLQDREGRRLKEYELEVVNDELIITDEEGELFEYHFASKESQRVQEALFHEKQTIIENCLFGVDINQNSVKICRLRLWIELLKHAYYKSPNSQQRHHSSKKSPLHPDKTSPRHPELVSGSSEVASSTKSPLEKGFRGVSNELETLPNIDINIKTGNSLISRFGLDADIKDALKRSKWSIDSYRVAVDTYRNAENKAQKKEMERLIEDIKSDFRTEIASNDPKVLRLKKLSDELVKHTTQTSMFEQTAKEKKEWKKKSEKLTKQIKKLETEIEEIKSNKIYENAFEWRFEFPEVLNEQGDFVGFDVVIGNPPYIRQEELGEIKPFLQNHYSVYTGTADLYTYFIEQGLRLLKEDGQFNYIVPNKWTRANYGKPLRTWLQQYKITGLIDFGDLPVFEEATTYPCLLGVKNTKEPGLFTALEVEELPVYDFENLIESDGFEVDATKLQEEGWSLVPLKTQQLLEKLKQNGTPLGKYVNEQIYYGIKTGYNKAFVIDEETKDRLIEEDASSAELIKPFLAGKEIKRYQQPDAKNYLILFKNGDTKEWFGNLEEDKAWGKIKTKYPSIGNYLEQFKAKAKARYDQGQYWWELRACDYYEEFEKSKIIYPNICKQPDFTFDEESKYTNQKCFIISLDDKFLLGYMNSKLMYFLFEMILPKLRGDFYEPSYVFLKEFPVPKPSKGIGNKSEKILSLKKETPEADTTKLEAEIDQMVYELYGLTEEEIAIVEESVG